MMQHLANKTQINPNGKPASALAEQAAIEHSVRTILTSLGENLDRDGLRRTPERVARMYQELTAGYHTDPVELVNEALFDVDYGEMVIVRDIGFYSLCEHHLLPFFGKAHVAYIPDGKVLGLSKIPRLVEMFARRLQLQERLTQQIADFINELLAPSGVAVVIEGVHLCSMMRGVKQADASMVTSAFSGLFKNDPMMRSEFMDHLNRRPLND
jgi:GTP cyclohydrolase I